MRHGDGHGAKLLYRRIGGLENAGLLLYALINLYRRIGGLENRRHDPKSGSTLYRRIGGLESVRLL